MSLLPRAVTCPQVPAQSLEPSENAEKALEKRVASQPFIGKWEDAHDFTHDNEYIRKGYRVNFNSVKHIFRSLFMVHNESMNIWSHLCGVILFICLVAYVAIWIRPRFVFPSFDVIESHLGLDVAATNLRNSSNSTSTYLENSAIQSMGRIKDYMSDATNAIKDYANAVADMSINGMNSIIDNLETLPAEIKERVFQIVNKKLNETSYYQLKQDAVLVQTIRPLFVHVTGAILCLLCSSMFHLFTSYSAKVHAFFARIDYGGISFLIAGTTFPPILYGFACDPLPKIVYVTVITSACLLAFTLMLIPGANTPKYRKLRGFLFIFVGLFAGVPAAHAASSSDPNIMLNLFYWAAGGVVYISGALIYVARIPERFAPGKFDFIGQSHNIFHCFVLIAAILHFLGSLETYHIRKMHMCPLN